MKIIILVIFPIFLSLGCKTQTTVNNQASTKPLKASPIKGSQQKDICNTLTKCNKDLECPNGLMCFASSSCGFPICQNPGTLCDTICGKDKPCSLGKSLPAEIICP